jgi:hypothetical protein
MHNNRIRQLIVKIENLKRQLPAHSVPPAMIIEIEELQDLLKKEKENLGNGDLLRAQEECFD